MEFFSRIASFETLHDGWIRVAANRGGPGGDRITIDAYGQGLWTRLQNLRRNLTAGTYVPGPLRRVDIPKKSGGVRQLAIPCVDDRVAQSAALLVLGPILEREFEDASFAYRPGRSVQQAVARVAALRRAGFTWAVDGDIERFFDNVPHDRLLRRLAQSIDDRRVLDLVGRWLGSFSGDGRGLAQGSPVSPLLANLYLDDIDERMADKSIRLVRFADDFVILCKSEVTAEAARQQVAALLAEHGLKLHPDKTRIVPFERDLRFLGHLFLRSLVLEEQAQAEDEAGRAAVPPRSPEEEAVLPRPVPELPIEAAAREPEIRPNEQDAVVENLQDGDPRSPGIRVLYVMEAGRRVMTNGKAFLVAEADTVHLALPASRLGRIEIGPRADIEPEALRLAAAQQIEVALVDGHGRTQCTLQPAGPGRAPRQLAQASAILDSARRTGIARRIVHARVHNQRALLSRLNRRRKDPAIDEAFEMMGRVRRKLDSADSVAALMGHEGEAAAGYWPALGRTLMHGFTFDRRRRHPANDPLNLMLNVLSSFLLRDMSALIGRHGLHSGFAFLHQADDREASLVFDLVEGFRAPLVEGLAVYLVNNRILKTDDFAVWDDEVCRIDADGMKALIRGWEDWLARLVVDPRGGDKVHWRRLMELDVEALAADLDGGPAFAPYLMDY